MDLNFHYFAVKAIAKEAGFKEEDAQIIASYSQFIDDYSDYIPIECDDVPVFAEHLTQKSGNKIYFYPVTTGFNTYLETARLQISQNQKEILIPFHFIPTFSLDKVVDDRSQWRVKPGNLSEKSLIQELLVDAQKKYRNNPNSRLCLIRLGLLLHVFADTYAHQGFSGMHGWENHAQITQAHDNTTQDKNSDITHNYSKYYYLPSVGHANIGHAPDDSHITYTIQTKKDKKDNYTLTKTQNNTETYLEAVKEILNYLRKCKGIGPISNMEWNNLEKKFTKGFLTPLKDKMELSQHWDTIFPNTKFYYTATKQKTLNTDFYYFNMVADEIRNYINGTPLSTGY